MTIDWYNIFMYGYYYPTLIVAIIYLIDLYRTIKKGKEKYYSKRINRAFVLFIPIFNLMILLIYIWIALDYIMDYAMSLRKR
jgi:hypothetical protein